jgi:hypothetical protein
MSFILGIDVWEGNPEINEAQLFEEDVRFMIVRLNSMSGGHHMDSNFYSQWEQVQAFIHWPYFVYNPWVSGQANFDWLAAHMPAEAGAVSIDIEVKKDGYSPKTYAEQVKIFFDQFTVDAQGSHPWNVNIYTGQWFLGYLFSWPGDREYWWARYPYALHADQRTYISWADLRTKLGAYGWHPGTTAGLCRLWQCTADRFILPGCGGTCVDINEWSGTLEELQAWAGNLVVPVRTWSHEIDAWARSQGYTGPDPG